MFLFTFSSFYTWKEKKKPETDNKSVTKQPKFFIYRKHTHRSSELAAAVDADHRRV